MLADQPLQFRLVPALQHLFIVLRPKRFRRQPGIGPLVERLLLKPDGEGFERPPNSRRTIPAISDESTPPDRNAPTSTSATKRRSTALIRASRNCVRACAGLPENACNRSCQYGSCRIPSPGRQLSTCPGSTSRTSRYAVKPGKE